MELENRSALVTGGAGGLGAATVRRLVDRGVEVAVEDDDPDTTVDEPANGGGTQPPGASGDER